MAGPKGKSQTSGGSNAVGPGYKAPVSISTQGRIDEGVDFGPAGVKIYAIGNAKEVGTTGSFFSAYGPGNLVYQLLDGSHKGMNIFVGEGFKQTAHGSFTAGQEIGEIYNAPCSACSTGTNPSIEMGFWDLGANHPYLNTCNGAAYGSSGCPDGANTDGGLMFARLCADLGVAPSEDPGPGSNGAGQSSGKVTGGAPSGGAATGGGGPGGLSEADVFAIGRAAALSSTLELPGLLNYEAAVQLKGDKSIYNDTPLMGFVQQMAQASLRQFQSLPNGTFFSFYPDYFGAYNHRKPYWEIDDIEIIEGQISLSDQDLATHVFVVGDTMPDGQITLPEQLASTGVVTIFDAFASNLMINGVAGTNGQIEKGKQKFIKLQDRTEAIAFLQRYGVRPHYEEAAFIRNHFFEMFYAFTQFQLYWSRQFLTEFQFTFMPELYPGGVVAFPDHKFRCYIDSVVHTFDYENGFLTQANLSAPAATDPNNDPGISRGMIKPLTASELKQLEQQNQKPPPKGNNNGGSSK